MESCSGYTRRNTKESKIIRLKRDGFLTVVGLLVIGNVCYSLFDSVFWMRH